MNKLLERYHSTLSGMMKEKIDDSKLFDIILEMYKESEILLKLAIEKFMSHGLISNSTIVKRIFAFLKTHLLSREIWEIILESDSLLFEPSKPVIFQIILDEFLKLSEEIGASNDNTGKIMVQDTFLQIIVQNSSLSKENADKIKKIMNFIGLKSEIISF